MTAPRQILRGATYHITRRCLQRQYLLRPSNSTNEVFLFVLALAARQFGILVHAYCVMSNHVHIVLTDPDARLPEFQQLLAALVARAVNASLGRWETFWAPGSYTAVRLLSPNDIVDTTAYTLANPVAAGLVRTGRLWPGLWSDPDRFGTSVEVERPRGFFSDKGSVPEKVSLELTTPPAFASGDDFRHSVELALSERERAAQQRVGSGFVGVARVLAQDPLARPASFEPRRTLRPRVAGRDPGKRVDALARLSQFVRNYREALRRRRAGHRDVVFPAGTYLLRVAHGVLCAGSG